MDIPLFHGIWTAVLLVIFIGIIVWAWSGKRKKDFDEAANLPLEDNEPVPDAEKRTKRSNHD